MMKYSDWEEWFGKIETITPAHLIDQEATMGKKPAKKAPKKAPADPKKTGK